MPRMMENISTVNSFLRTIIALVVIGVLGVGGYYGYMTYTAADRQAREKDKKLADAQIELTAIQKKLDTANVEIEQKDARIREQDATIVDLNKQVEKLATSLKLLKIDHRLARLTAVDKTTDETTGKPSTLVEFVELNDEGNPIDTPRQFRIPGEEVYVDSWLVQFEDKYVEEADLERGTSLILFKRLFGSDQTPEDGYPLDEIGAAPKAYARGGKMSDLEKKIFGDFWSIANDESQAKDLGIRAAHGQAVSMKVEEGKSYRVMLRASGGLSIVPEEVERPVER